MFHSKQEREFFSQITHHRYKLLMVVGRPFFIYLSSSIATTSKRLYLLEIRTSRKIGGKLNHGSEIDVRLWNFKGA